MEKAAEPRDWRVWRLQGMLRITEIVLRGSRSTVTLKASKWRSWEGFNSLITAPIHKKIVVTSWISMTECVNEFTDERCRYCFVFNFRANNVTHRWCGYSPRILKNFSSRLKVMATVTWTEIRNGLRYWINRSELGNQDIWLLKPGSQRLDEADYSEVSSLLFLHDTMTNMKHFQYKTEDRRL